MAKLTQFGRMRRRIKKELEAARTTRIMAHVQAAQILAAGHAQVELIRDSVVTVKMLNAWKKEREGKLSDAPGPVFNAEPITLNRNSNYE